MIPPNQRLLLCSQSHNNVPDEHQGNKSMTAIRSAVRPSIPNQMLLLSNSLNDVSRVAQRTEPWPLTSGIVKSVLVVFVVFMRGHVQFWSFDKAGVTSEAL